MKRDIDLKAYGVAHSWHYLFDGEVFALYALSASLPDEARIVNIGAGSGTSSLALREANHYAEMWTVDISPSGPLGGLENERNAFESTGYTLPNQVLCDSKEFGRSWHYPPVDFVFVDGDHSYEGCWGDLEAWWPHLKEGGYMAIHDYGPSVWPDVKRAVDRFIRESDGNAEILFWVDTLMIVRKHAG